MNAAGSPSSSKRKAEQSQDNYEATGKKLKIEDSVSFCNNPMVTLLVGPDRLSFHVHRNLLCENSPFFAAAFNGSFKESSGLMELIEDSADAFERFVQWLYRRKFTISPVGDAQCTKQRYQQLVRVYIVADKFDVPLLKDHVIVLFFDSIRYPNGQFRLKATAHHDFCPRTNIVKLVYTNTAKGSPLRKFLAAFYAWHYSITSFEDETFWDFYSDNLDFIKDVSMNLARRANNRSDPLKDMSNFMEPLPHDQSEEG
ncbi:MAG: hypothetical protein Q9192_002166 [Flavoplaca navasiana]